MALIKCVDCGHNVSDRALACPKCGGPMLPIEAEQGPDRITLDVDNFIGTKALIVQLAVMAVQKLNYKVDSADEASGIVTLTTGMTMGSWSGVSGSLVIQEVAPFTFNLSGRGKQNVRGGQLFAPNLFGEANKKIGKVIEMMRRIVLP